MSLPSGRLTLRWQVAEELNPARSDLETKLVPVTATQMSASDRALGIEQRTAQRAFLKNVRANIEMVNAVPKNYAQDSNLLPQCG